MPEDVNDAYKRVIRWRLRQIRLRRRLRQDDVAERSEMSLRRYQEFEGGRGKFNPTLDTLLKLAAVLETPVEELMRTPTEEELKRSLKRDSRRVFKSEME